MKRIFFGLLLLCAVGFLACENKPNSNNATPNANGAATPTASTSPSPTISTGGMATPGVPITIYITDKSGKPVIDRIDPDEADLSDGKQADWIIANRSSLPTGQNASVDISHFKGDATGGDMPFGAHAGSNDFYLDLLQEGTTRHSISNPSRDDGKNYKYKYTVTLYQADGTQLDIKDPQIIVGIGGGKPQNGTAPASPPKASPTKSTTKP